MKRQLAFLLARARVPIEWVQGNIDEGAEELPEDLVECISNTKLSAHFREFGKELSVLEPKSLEDVYKSHLENTRKSKPYLASYVAYRKDFKRRHDH